jgi:hypothetical protein
VGACTLVGCSGFHMGAFAFLIVKKRIAALQDFFSSQEFKFRIEEFNI